MSDNNLFPLKKVFLKIHLPATPEHPLVIEGEVKTQNRYDDDNITLGIKLNLAVELVELFNRLGIEQEGSNRTRLNYFNIAIVKCQHIHTLGLFLNKKYYYQK